MVVFDKIIVSNHKNCSKLLQESTLCRRPQQIYSPGSAVFFPYLFCRDSYNLVWKELQGQERERTCDRPISRRDAPNPGCRKK